MKPVMQQTKTCRLARAVVVLTAVAGALSACEEPVAPRNFADFMEDRIAREGTLVRCNANPEATLNDIECANARRAAAAIALRQERERREALERESEVKLAALRARLDEQQRLAAAAAAAEEEAYESLWRESGADGAADGLLDPVRLPAVARPQSADTRAPSSPDRTHDGADGLEEIVVSRRFTWRPAGGE